MPDRGLAFVNGVVHTVDDALPRAEAIAVRDGRIFGFREYQLLRPGPRVAQALETIARFLHPERMKNDGR